MESRVFFPSGPPPFAPVVSDSLLSDRIQKSIEFAVRNGPGFIEEVRRKQHGNRDYAFLQGGEGSAYFSWALYCRITGHPPTQPLPVAALPAAPPLPEEVRSGWSTVLSMLNGTRESITQSQAWFMACAPYAAGMAQMTIQRATTLQGFEPQLHILYLINDILLKAQSQRPVSSGSDADAVATAFRPLLGSLLRRLYTSAGGQAELQQKVVKVANIWSEKGVFPGPVVETMVMEMMGLAPPPPPPQPPAHHIPGAQLLPPHPHLSHRPPPPQQPPPGPLASGAAPWQVAGPAVPWGGPTPSSEGPLPGSIAPQAPPFPPDGHPDPRLMPLRPMAPPQRPPPPHHAMLQHPMHIHAQHGTPGMQYQPPGMAIGQHGVGVEPHAVPAPPPEPEEPPFDCMSFPPGLIPKLVEDKLQIDPPYTPLTPEDIQRCPVPPPPKMDDYLKARLDKFYAQLADYRPGMSFSDLEADPPRRRHFSDRQDGAAAPGAGMHAAPAARHEVDDGSAGFRGGGGGARGLGYGSSNGRGQEGDADVFDSYRRMRSSGYHDLIVRNAAGKGGR